MTAWRGLLNKEWKLMKVNMMIIFIIMAVAPIVIYSISRYFEVPSIFTSLMIGFIIAHVFYLPILFLDLLNKEGGTQLWLYNPNGMTKMILAKFVPSFVVFIVSLLWTICITFLVAFSFDSLHLGELLLPWKTWFATASIGVVILTIGAMLLSLWVLFLWTIYHALARIQLLKKIRWIIVLALLMCVQVFSNWLQGTAFLEQIKQVWLVKIQVPYFETEATNQGFTFQFGPVGTNGMEGMMEFPVIHILLQLFIALLMFLFSVWLLERKVEV